MNRSLNKLFCCDSKSTQHALGRIKHYVKNFAFVFIINDALSAANEQNQEEAETKEVSK